MALRPRYVQVPRLDSTVHRDSIHAKPAAQVRVSPGPLFPCMRKGVDGRGWAQIQPWYHIRDSQDAYGITLPARIGYRYTKFSRTTSRWAPVPAAPMDLRPRVPRAPRMIKPIHSTMARIRNGSNS